MPKERSKPANFHIGRAALVVGAVGLAIAASGPGLAQTGYPNKPALAAQGFAPMIGSAEDFDAFYRAERTKWAKVITATGMDKE